MSGIIKYLEKYAHQEPTYNRQFMSIAETEKEKPSSVRFLDNSVQILLFLSNTSSILVRKNKGTKTSCSFVQYQIVIQCILKNLKKLDF